MLMNARGEFYKYCPDPKKYFEGATRETLKKFIKSFIDCEVSVELVRKRIHKKLRMKTKDSFAAMDEFQKGVLTIDDFRSFLRRHNLYPVEKNLELLFNRLDRDGDRQLLFEEFVQGLTCFN